MVSTWKMRRINDLGLVNFRSTTELMSVNCWKSSCWANICSCHVPQRWSRHLTGRGKISDPTLVQLCFNKCFKWYLQHANNTDYPYIQVFTQNIRHLSHEITPGHRSLKIPRHYRYEAPWPSAQAEIRRLAAYKTPADKVSCVTRCCQTIMNLLSMASGTWV